MTSKHFLNKSAKNVISYLLRLMTGVQLYFSLENSPNGSSKFNSYRALVFRRGSVYSIARTKLTVKSGGSTRSCDLKVCSKSASLKQCSINLIILI